MGSCVMVCSQKPNILSRKKENYLDPLEKSSIQRQLQENAEPSKADMKSVNSDIYTTKEEKQMTKLGCQQTSQRDEMIISLSKSRFCPDSTACSAQTVSGIIQSTAFQGFSDKLQHFKECESRKTQLPYQSTHQIDQSTCRQYSIQNSVPIGVIIESLSRKNKSKNIEKTLKKLRESNSTHHSRQETKMKENLKQQSKKAAKRLKTSIRQGSILSLTESTVRPKMSVQEIKIVKNQYVILQSSLKNSNDLHTHLIPSSQQPQGTINMESVKLTSHFDVPTANNLEVQYDDESIYLGEWMAGVRHGKGTLSWKDGRYQGEWKMNKMSGYGIIRFVNGEKYEGQWQENQAHGVGDFFCVDGSFYSGRWQHNKQSGEGIQQWSKNESYSGQWSGGYKHGFGKLTFSDGSYYEGDFDHNQFHGRGYYYQHERMTYQGQWEHNKKCGKGVLKMIDGSVYEGEFLNNRMHGRGKWTGIYGYTFEGDWQCGRKHGCIIETTLEGEVRKGLWYLGKFIGYYSDEPSQLYELEKRRLREGEYYFEVKEKLI